MTYKDNLGQISDIVDHYGKEKNYWLNKLSGDLGSRCFPYDYSRNTNISSIKTSKFDFSLKLSRRVIEIAGGSDIRLHMILTAGLVILLYKYTGDQDILVGIPIYRQKQEGEFTNTVVVIRNTLEEDLNFKKLIIQVRQSITEAMENANYPIESLLHNLNLSYSGNDFPLFDVAILLENIHDKKYLHHIPNNMTFSFRRNDDNLEGELDYNSVVFEETTVERILQHFLQLMENAVFNLDTLIFGINILAEKEKKKILYEFNNSRKTSLEEKNICRLFETQTKKKPDRIAVSFNNDQLSYRQFNEKANQLARYLLSKGIQQNQSVGIIMKRSLEMVISIMATWKAGGAYIPIDPDYPLERIAYMLENSRTLLLLTDTLLSKKKFITPLYFQPGKVKPYLTVPRPDIMNFDSLPVPDRSLINYEKYQRHIDQVLVENGISLQATRGCPLECALCHKIWSKNHRVRSAENIFAEVKFNYNLGIRQFAFVDDIFNFDLENSSRFFKLIIENKLDVQFFFPNGMRGDILTKDYIDLMVEAGTVDVALALETASPRLQKLIGKNLNLEKLRENITYFLEKYPGVILELFSMYGFPTETEKEAMMTLEFIKSLKWVHFPYVSILKIFPKTEIEKLAIENGISPKTIARSANLAGHELPETLPFDKKFILKYQSEFLNDYFLKKERLLHVLPHQMNILNEDQLIQKYNSFLPTNINTFDDLFQLAGISKEELGVKANSEDSGFVVPNLNEKMQQAYSSSKPLVNSFRVLLLDLSLYFTADRRNTIFDIASVPLGLMYLMTYLKKQFGNRINGKIAKSRIDFNNYEELYTLVKEFKPDVIGIRTMTLFKEFFHKTVSVIRNWGIRNPIIVGGPYATNEYETMLLDRNIDLVVLGEGEVTFSEIIGKMLAERGVLPSEEVLEQIPGIAFIPKKGGTEEKETRTILFPAELKHVTTYQSSENLEPLMETKNLAYIIYTSGSTGIPKGVMIEHIGMINHIWSKINDLHVTGDSIIAQNASHTFDISVWQFFTALVSGGRTIIYPNELVMEPDKLMPRLRKDQVTILEVVPSYLAVMLEYLHVRYIILESLCYLIVTGETVKPALVKQWYKMCPGIRLVNAYGPTEASDDITHYMIDNVYAREHISIGKPIQNLSIYIVDERMNLCPIGVKGEICVSGVGVGRGYLNDPEKTNRLFVEIPSYDDKRKIRIYKTGDFGYWLPDGNIEFIGRKDTQVKIRGFRIELGEIENKLLEYKKVKDAVVIANTGLNEPLCAYIVADEPLDFSVIKNYLLESLPSYSVPTCYVKLDRFPLTPNGKIDRKNLPKPTPESSMQMPYITEAELKNVVIKPDKKLVNTGIPIQEGANEYELSREEMEQILYTFNNTRVEYPLDTLPHQLIETQVEKTPDWVAIGHKGNYLTYRRLNERANQLARLLRAKGVTRNYLVGILMPRNFELIIGLLGILKSGGTYLPIDSESPKDRKKYMVELSGIKMLLTNREQSREIGAAVSQIIDLHDGINYRGDAANLPVQSAPTDLIHVLFTSGTTGIPKGVMIENRSIVNLINGFTDLVPIDETDIIFSVIPTTFDMFGSETIVPLTRGSRIMVGTIEEKNNFKMAAKALEEESATFYQATPSLLLFMISDTSTITCLQTLRYLIVAGEAFPPAVRDKAAEVMKGKIFNFYGPTEAAIFATGKDVSRMDSLNNIGKPLANVGIYILNSERKVLPIGVVGELYIGGIGVARGYLKEDDLTTERFIVNPFVKGDRLYRTGDTAKWLPDGEIEFLGRIDHQVQIRGIRVEPGEIENVLLINADIKEAAVVAKESESGQIDLFGCIVSDKRLSGEKLRKDLFDKLPGYMIPGYFIQSEKMPLTPNGKINRRLLESIEIKEGNQIEHEAPRNPLEEKLVEIWGDVLGRKNIGIHENFFMIGGDSIKTIQIASRMKKAGYKIEMKNIFENPTVAQLAPFIKELDRVVEQTPITGIVPLIPIQKAFFSDLPKEPHHFNMSVMFFSSERLSEKAVRIVFSRLQEHHDALRMTFNTTQGEIIQFNHGLEYPLEIYDYDLTGKTHPEATALLEEKAGEMQRSICLEKGPLLKLGLFHLDDGDRLLIVLHHLVVDGVSWRILLEDIDTLFNQFRKKERLTLPMKTDSFKTWAEHLSDYANSTLFLKEKSYWEKLESTIVPGIVKDFQEEINYQRDSETLMFRLNVEKTELLLTKVNNAFGTEINDILITSLGLAVKDNFGIDKVLIELEGHGREEILKNIDIKRTVGWFTSAFPIILDVSYASDLARQVKEIKENLHRVPYKGIGYGILKYMTSEEHRKGMNFQLKPQISFNYLGQFDEDINQTTFNLAKEKTGDNEAPSSIRKYELDISGMIMEKQLEISISYNKRQYRMKTIKTLLDHLESHLVRIISFCSERDRELTPSDFGYKNISLTQLDSLFD